MKKRSFIFLILAALALNLPVSAQTDFGVFWMKFKTAVKSKDKNTVAALTKFPLSMPCGQSSVKKKHNL